MLRSLEKTASLRQRIAMIRIMREGKPMQCNFDNLKDIVTQRMQMLLLLYLEFNYLFIYYVRERGSRSLSHLYTHMHTDQQITKDVIT